MNPAQPPVPPTPPHNSAAQPSAQTPPASGPAAAPSTPVQATPTGQLPAPTGQTPIPQQPLAAQGGVAPAAAPAGAPPAQAPGGDGSPGEMPAEAQARLAALQQAADALAAFEAGDQDAQQGEAAASTDELVLPDFVREIARSAPRMLIGDERLRFFCERLDAAGFERREQLRDFLDTFVSGLHFLGASDMDLGGPACVGRVWYRVDGDKQPYDEIGASSTDEIDIMILNLLTEKQRKDLFDVQSADFSHFLTVPGGNQRRFRCTVYFDNQHLGLCMRAINEEVRKLDAIGFHPLIQRGMMFRHVRDGLTLITGVTGSGKSTTLDAVIDANNHDFPGHIVIVAKPIEYMHSPDRCIIRHREVGPDVPTFKDGVVQALRQDPDIIMIGEMRDPETISSAIEASDTGHKVFSTLHTSSAIESLDRMVAEYPPDEQDRVRLRLADVLRCVVSQKLPPRIGGGRVLTKEVLWVTANVKAAILNGNTPEIYQMMWEGGRHGMVTLEQDLARLVKERKITPEIGLQYANNKKRFRQLVGG